MPLTRCLGCRKYIDSKLSRCGACKKALKDDRNREAARLGPCPQSGECGICRGLKGPATPQDPYVWHHTPVRFVDGGRTAVPAHKSCNEGLKRANAAKPHS